MSNQTNLLVLDFETYYDKDFGLHKQTIPQYVHDPRFHVHGLAVGYPDGTSTFYTDVEVALRRLQAHYGQQLERIIVVCHHAQFDLYILNRLYGLKPRFFADTMLLAHHIHGRRHGGPGRSASLKSLAELYGLQSKDDLSFMLGVRNPNGRELAELASYARNDVAITRQLANHLLPQLSRPEVELLVIMHTVRLFSERSIMVDMAGIAALGQEVHNETQQYLQRAGATSQSILNDRQFAHLLSDALARTGRLLPLKLGKQGDIPAIAKKDEAMQALLGDDDPVVQSLAEARLKQKSEMSLLARLDTLQGIAAATGGVLPPYLTYDAAHTGRFGGGGKFNLQNLGRDGFGGEVRKLLRPRPGHIFVIGDLAQIECRITAWYAAEVEQLQAFGDGRDIYSEFASETLGGGVRKPCANDTPEMKEQLQAKRQVGKQAVLGLGFGMGSLKFMNTLRADRLAAKLFASEVLNPGVCWGIVKAFRKKYAAIVSFWGQLESAFRHAMDGEEMNVGPLIFNRNGTELQIRLPSTRMLRYPDARYDDTPRDIRYLNKLGETASFTPEGSSIVYGDGVTLYGGKLCENIVQATARDVLVEAILDLERSGHPVCFHVHDEVIVETPVDKQQVTCNAVEAHLSHVPAWAIGLPLKCEVEIKDRYGK